MDVALCAQRACVSVVSHRTNPHPLSTRVQRSRRQHAAQRVGVSCSYTPRSFTNSRAAGRGGEGQSTGRSFQEEAYDWRNRAPLKQVSILTAQAFVLFGFTGCCGRNVVLHFYARSLRNSCHLQTEAPEQQVVRLSRSQIINKSIITRSAGLNLGVASQVISLGDCAPVLCTDEHPQRLSLPPAPVIRLG